MALLTASFCLALQLFAPEAAPAPGEPVPLSAARLQFLRQGLPRADHARQITIEAARLSPADRNNTTYLRVLDANDRLVGYVRDFVGPVSPNQACPCNPLHVSLVFLPDLRLQTLLAPAPLQKWGHEAMSEAEFAQLIALMKKLPATLCAVPTVEDMVDATSGATRQALADVVVHHAALSTRRLAGVVSETRAILQHRPIDSRRQKLLATLSSPLPPAERAHQLASLVEAFDEQEMRLQAFHIMVQAYVQALEGGAAGDPQVEKAILNFAVLCEGGGNEITSACLKIAQTRRRIDFVERCARHLQTVRARGVAPQTPALLLGTAYFMDAQFARALPLLQKAALDRTVQEEPHLYLRLAKAQAIAGERDAALQTLALLLTHHPRIPDGEATLLGVVGPQAAAALKAQVTARAKERFLATEVEVAGPFAAASLRDEKGGEVQLHVADPNAVTVLVYFATWCPHCQAELPQLRAFLAQAAQDPTAPPVRVVAVRTAVEKENAAAQRFWAGFAPNFAVYVDGDMSQAFAAFARTTGRPTMLPTTAVSDRPGTPRYFFEPGRYRDVRAELSWAVGAAAAD